MTPVSIRPPPLRFLLYLQHRNVHDSGEGWLEHHGDAGADGHHDHDPVQIGNEAQKIAARTSTLAGEWVSFLRHRGKKNSRNVLLDVKFRQMLTENTAEEMQGEVLKERERLISCSAVRKTSPGLFNTKQNPSLTIRANAGWITINFHYGWNLFQPVFTRRFSSLAAVAGQRDGRSSFRTDEPSAGVWASRSAESEGINNSSHLLQLVVFGVLHRSGYGVCFGSRSEFIKRISTFCTKKC